MLVLKFILSVTLTVSLAHASFSFKAAPAKVSANEFNRYVLPQLKSIDKEFFNLFQDFEAYRCAFISM